MKNKVILLSIILTTLSLFFSCDEDSWLERDPKNRISDDQLWNDPALIKSLLSNYYDRLPSFGGLFNLERPTQIDDAMWSGHNDQNGRNDFAYADDYGRYWDYGLIRDINLALENLDKKSTLLTETQKKQYNAELRFLRAFVYFELVKRMGGVPLVTTQLIYDNSGDPTPLQVPRAKESEVYDFIYNEIQEIKDNFTETSASRTRANYFIALALQSRAMLYAGSIAKYNNLMSAPITLPGGEVGIPADRANDYYQKSLAASEAIIASPQFELYNPAGSSKGQSFYNLFMDKGLKEFVFAKDYSRAAEKLHGFTFDNVVKSLRTDIEGSSSISPSLSLVESFEYLDGSKGTLRDKDESGNYIAYTNPEDIFANKDARLYGTIVYAGSTFRSVKVDIQAGVATWANGKYSFKNGELGSKYTDGNKFTGLDGPKNNEQFVSNTGFYLRKFVSEDPQAGVRPTLAENWWPWIRLGEIYLNAAEAAFELGNANAKDYINKLRERAGFPANSISNLTIEIIRNERRVELAFEDHRFFDLKRWRIADQIWNGQETDPNAVVYGLYPYRVYRPGHPDDGKYIFDRMRPTRFKRARFFRPANYYSSIEQSVLNNNPKLVKNPFH